MSTPPASADQTAAPAHARWDRSFLGHPRGLSTLFFTEMWERFSFYGMRALLILFMVATVEHGGLGFSAAKAATVYGLYTSMVYLVTLPGGWIADKIIGQRRAVLWGGVVIALGHFAMAIPSLETFYLGLALIVVGTGLLKPNISTMVGALYRPDDVRRDAGFSVFYMGINIGALLSPLVCGYLGENINWHYGFGAAGIGMALGLVQYILGDKYLGPIGRESFGTAKDLRVFRSSLLVAVVLIAVAAGLAVTGAVSLASGTIYNIFGVVLMTVVIGFFISLLTSKSFTPVEKNRLWLILILFLAASFFWGAYEQAGSTLNLFAERNTNLHAWDYPLWGLFRASYFQSLNSVFVVALAAAFAWIWVALRRHEPSSTFKFALGLVGVGLGFAILIPVAHSHTASPWWLTVSYFLQTLGELCLSPVGLSAMTKLAPTRIVGMMMGVWFMADSVGNYIGGQFAGYYETMDLAKLFGIVAGLCFLFALVMVFLIRPMRKLTGGVN